MHFDGVVTSAISRIILKRPGYLLMSSFASKRFNRG
jgi:hypothetical protein